MTFIISAIISGLIVLAGFSYYNYAQSPSPSQTVSETDSPRQETPSTLVSVDRSGQKLSQLPADILGMHSLQSLDLSNNNLSGALPAEIRQLQKLQVLDISENAMTGLPAEIGQLSQLRILDASNNQLTGIPHELGNLQNLEILDLSGNTISEFDLDAIRAKLPATVQILL